MRIALLAVLPLTGGASAVPARSGSPGVASGVAARAAAVSPAPGSAGSDAPAPPTLAARARHLEDHGAYPEALVEWRRLRALVPPDADLELATALAEARSGQLDSAAARLDGRILSLAALDTLPATRYHVYPPNREALYLNGDFDGWHWYVWRARAEVAAARGRWEEAAAAARRCVAARPVSGKEWLLLAVCAGRAGDAEEARAAARQAVVLDRGLPESLYLDALWAWKDGRRAEAQDGLRAAIAADSTFRPAAMALLRMRLPASAPDPLPGEFLTGPRAVGMLTSRAGPKLDEWVAHEGTPIFAHVVRPEVPDSLRDRVPNAKLRVWLFVDPEGRVVLHDLPWQPPDRFPVPLVAEFVSLLPQWRFGAETVRGDPRGIWVDVSHAFPR